jgi:hypothetical protein
MESRDRDDQPAPEESEGEHPQERAAEELSGRSAESVGRRYDATKESVHEGHHDTGHDDTGHDEDARD